MSDLGELSALAAKPGTVTFHTLPVLSRPGKVKRTLVTVPARISPNRLAVVPVQNANFRVSGALPGERSFFPKRLDSSVEISLTNLP
jgi:hypothetical protein